MKKQLLLILVLFAFGLTSINSQILNPVKWSYKTEQVSDTEVNLISVATIDKHWHLYGQFFEDGGPIKLVFTFEKSDKYELIGQVKESPSPKKEMDDIFGIEVQWFADKATFTQRIRVKSAQDFTINMYLDGQACQDDGMCVPIDDEYDFQIKGVVKSETYTETTENTVNESNQQNETDTQDNGAENVVDNKTENLTDNSETDSEQDLPDSIDDKELSTVDDNKKTVEARKTPIIAKNNPWKNQDTGVDQTLIWFFLIAMGFGFTALVTPCVFPMIPMTVSFFMHSEKSKRRSRINATLYGISIVLIYTLPIAMVIGLANVFGNESVSGDFANWLSTHWLPNIFFFLIFFVFAASFFGMFEITLPSWLVNKSDEKADKGGLLGVFFMAFTLVLVSFSCTGPIVGGILVESTQGGSFLKPIIGMLGFSMGVALPFTLFAFFPEMLKKLPKSGGWLNSVKVVLGFIELALGLKFLSIADQTYHWGLLDREIYLALWIIIFALMGLYLLGKLKFAHDSELPYIKVPRLMLAIITFSFVIYLIPGMWGAPLKALSGYLPPQSTHDFDLTKLIRGENASKICDIPKYGEQLHLPHGLNGYFDYNQAVNCAKEQNKPIFIDFTGHGCVNCREMEASVWSDPRVLKILKEDYVILALYVDDKVIQVPEDQWFTSTYDGKVKKSVGKQNSDIQIVNFNKNSQPYYVLIDSDANVLAQPHAYDLNVENFIKFLEAGKTAFQNR